MIKFATDRKSHGIFTDLWLGNVKKESKKLTELDYVGGRAIKVNGSGGTMYISTALFWFGLWFGVVASAMIFFGPVIVAFIFTGVKHGS